MFACDTSSLVAYLKGESGFDVEGLDTALQNSQIFLPPVVLSEIFSDPRLPKKLKEVLLQIPLAPLNEDHWKNAGLLRAALIQKKLKARLGDALITQTCLENDFILISRDADFRHYEKYFRLKLYRSH